MSNPVAVLTADVHYNISTLSLADKAMRMAIERANDLDVPLVVAGDLHDTKAALRGECVEAMIETFSLCNKRPSVIVGNHCRRNERSPEHSLHFLSPYADIIQSPVRDCSRLDSWLIPYYSDVEELRTILAYIPEGSRIIMHQGLFGSDMGHYIQDKSRLNKEDVANFRVVSGHYHRRQDIKCGRPRRGAVGLFSYIGNPYTLTFSEANDPDKGFQILHDDGILEFVPTKLRKHVVIETTPVAIKAGDEILHPFVPRQDDLVWLKVTGPQSELSLIDKQELGNRLFGHSNFKLDKIPSQCEESVKSPKVLSEAELLDSIIDDQSDTDPHKNSLKKLWRELME